MPVNLEKIDSIKNLYCSPKLLDSLQQQEPDYDPFINAQDLDDDLNKKLSIAKDTPAESIYITSYMDNYHHRKIKIKLWVKEIAGHYKITNLEDLF